MTKETDIKRITRRYMQRLARNITVNKAILTGSRARGTYLEDSDVDLIIISNDFSAMPFSERLSYLQKEWRNRIPLEAFGYTVEEFRKLRQRSTYVRDAIRNGIFLVEPGPSAPKRGGFGAARGIGPFTNERNERPRLATSLKTEAINISAHLG